MTDSRPFWADEPPPDPWDLPPDPVAPSKTLPESYKRMVMAAGGMVAAAALAFVGGGVA